MDRDDNAMAESKAPIPRVKSIAPRCARGIVASRLVYRRTFLLRSLFNLQFMKCFHADFSHRASTGMAEHPVPASAFREIDKRQEAEKKRPRDICAYLRARKFERSARQLKKALDSSRSESRRV